MLLACEIFRFFNLNQDAILKHKGDRAIADIFRKLLHLLGLCLRHRRLLISVFPFLSHRISLLKKAPSPKACPFPDRTSNFCRQNLDRKKPLLGGRTHIMLDLP